jgi:hypothetical protein
MKQILQAVVIIGVCMQLIAGCKPPASRQTELENTVVSTAPVRGMTDAVLTSLDGKRSLSLSELTGSTSLLYFFGPWTDSGSTAMQWMKEFKHDGIRLIPLVVDARSPDAQPTIPGIDSFDLTIYRTTPELLDAIGGVRALPTALLLGTSGEVVQRWSGYTAITTVVSTIQSVPVVKSPDLSEN